MSRSTMKVTESTIKVTDTKKQQKKRVRFGIVVDAAGAGAAVKEEENESNQPKFETVHFCDSVPRKLFGDYFWSDEEIDSILQRELSLAKGFIGNSANKPLIDCIYYLLGYDVENHKKVDEESDPLLHKKKLARATRMIAESATYGLEKKMIPLFTAHRSWALKEIMKSQEKDSGETSMSEASRRVSQMSCLYAHQLANGMEQYIKKPVVVKKTHKVPIKKKLQSSEVISQTVPPQRPQLLRKRISVRNNDESDDDATLLVAPKQHRKGVSCCG